MHTVKTLIIGILIDKQLDNCRSLEVNCMETRLWFYYINNDVFKRVILMTLETDITILNRLGLHARPASRFAKLASGFKSDIWLIKDGEEVDGKSILEVLTLACPQGSVLTVRAEGPDAEEAVKALKALVESRFGEID